MSKQAAPDPETVRARRLREAEDKAEQLLGEVARRGLIAPGRWESAVSDDVRDLGAELFDTTRHWHKRIVRSGENTLAPYRENPPDRRITDDDIVFLDLGPVFSAWEADVGRTFVLGDDPVKRRLRDDLDQVWNAAADWFDARPGTTGEELYAQVVGLASEHGWTFGGAHSGHLVGEFPHEWIDAERLHSYITPGNDTVMRTAVDGSGRQTHWILEVHLVDEERRIGGFTERLLTLRR